MNDRNRSAGVAEALQSFPRHQPRLTASMTASQARYRASSQAPAPLPRYAHHQAEFAAAAPRFVTRQSREASSRQSSSGDSQRPSHSRESRQQTRDGVGSAVRERSEHTGVHRKDKVMESGFFRIGGYPPAAYGLYNLGNTCYQNAVVQPLVRTPWFWDWFTVAFDDSDDAHWQTFICPRSPYRGHVASVFATLMREFSSDGASEQQGGVVDPSDFRRVFGENKKEFKGRRQQDSAEFLGKLLECLHEDTNRIQEKPPFQEMDDRPGETPTEASDRWWTYDHQRSDSIVSDVFGGQLMTEIICPKCGHIARNFETNWSLPLTIPDDETAEVELDECLKTFCKIEVLRGDDVWYCPKCKEHVEASRQVTIFRCPPVLVVTLNRFRKDKFGGTEGIFNAKRLNTPVRFKMRKLCLAEVHGLCEHSEDPTISREYDLFAVTHHDGILHGGHYYAYAKLVVNGVVSWVRFDDIATEYFMPEEQLQGSAAYILWYQARDMPKVFQEKRKVRVEVPLPRSIDNPVVPSSRSSSRDNPSSVLDKDTEDITSPLDDSTDIAAPAAAADTSHLPAPTVRPSKPSTVPPPAPAAHTPPAAPLSPPPVHAKAPSAITTTTTEREETAERPAPAAASDRRPSAPLSSSLPSIPLAAGQRARYGYGSRASQGSLDSGYERDYEDGPLGRNIMRDLGHRGMTVGVHGAAAAAASPTGGSASRSILSDPLEPQPLAPSLSRDRHFQQSLRLDEAVRASYASATTTQPSVGASSSRSNRIGTPTRTTAADTAGAGSTFAMGEVRGGSLSNSRRGSGSGGGEARAAGMTTSECERLIERRSSRDRDREQRDDDAIASLMPRRWSGIGVKDPYRHSSRPLDSQPSYERDEGLSIGTSHTAAYRLSHNQPSLSSSAAAAAAASYFDAYPHQRSSGGRDIYGTDSHGSSIPTVGHPPALMPASPSLASRAQQQREESTLQAAQRSRGGVVSPAARQATTSTDGIRRHSTGPGSIAGAGAFGSSTRSSAINNFASSLSTFTGGRASRGNSVNPTRLTNNPYASLSSMGSTSSSRNRNQSPVERSYQSRLFGYRR
ncbi:unnamed protein product [Vitrella brassicaformis CCMP3155]|uniref:USP domain-containing protein n=2 Tax=Vitrella brassicaformis TaxID=1169539 RepID=A0A0G4FBK8_VITBC|nr:unnamed protein product [Vitrella brassicaformis CCMP3155]|eukprot:CEM10255.1 unnamed protein product [Vitrella brassicaformis CCMP3155]